MLSCTLSIIIMPQCSVFINWLIH